MPRPRGQVDRTLDSLGAGLLLGKHKRDHQLGYSRLREVEQQVRVPLEGEASNEWGYADKEVNWELPFVGAPAQRDAPFTTPHFSYGVELGAGSGSLIVIHASIVKWNTNIQGYIIGAVTRFMASAPGGEGVAYTAVMHLSFQGYAAEFEADT